MHNLNESKGRTAMMYTGERPWHGLGTELKNPATAAEAIVAAGLDYDVKVEPMVIASDGAEVPDAFAVRRTDTLEVLGTVGKRFKPLQNRESFGAFDAVVGAGKAIYHTAGALGKGERVWILAKLPGEIVIKGIDTVEKYMLLANGHDGSLSVKAGWTPVRVVCQNTLSLALGEKDTFISVRHTGDIQKRVEAAFKALGIIERKYTEMQEFFNALASKPLFGENLTKVVEEIFPGQEGKDDSTRLTNIRKTVMERIESGKGNALPGIRGTAWAAFNGVVEFLDHDRVVKGAKDDEREKTSRRMGNIWFGNIATVRERAAKVIRAAVGV